VAPLAFRATGRKKPAPFFLPMSPVRWIDSTSWELPFYGLPSRIPWPATVDEALASQEPLDVEHLLEAIELLGPEAGEPWAGFLKANDHFADLLEALEDNELGPALDALDAIDALLPDTSFALFHRALIARREGSDEDALELYRAAAAKTPQIAAIWSSLGAVHALRSEREEAIAAFRKALELQPNDATALEGLATLGEVVKLRTADPRQADTFRYVDLPTFRQIALRQVAAFTDAEQLFEYGDQLLRDGTALEAAVRAFERSCELRPAQPKSMHALATAYRAAGRPEQARDTLQRYTLMYPQDANGFLHLAQSCHDSSDRAGELAALEHVLKLDPNSQPALAARFALGPGEHDPAKEDEIVKYAADQGSWMAYLLAATVARERGDHRAALRHAERAYALQPEAEEVLLHYASALADRKELAKLASVIRPAVESGKYSKRLDWHYAHVLRQLGLTKDALGVLRNAVQGEVSDQFRQMVGTTIDAWSNRITGCGVQLELVGEGFLQRPVVIKLEDGDGGVLINAGARLPQEARFPWRPSGGKAAVRLQQGESGGTREPADLGVFLVRGIKEAPGGPASIECHLAALPDGALHFRATQGQEKLEVTWAPKV
jgi:tetratricopeptide (TPR) repeat protein